MSAGLVEAQQVVQEAPVRPGGARHNAVLRGGVGETREPSTNVIMLLACHPPDASMSCIRNAYRCSLLDAIVDEV